MSVDVEQMKSSITLLPLSVIRLDGGTQPRAELNTEHINDLAEILLDGSVFKDPIIVFYDGSTYWLADGFHRVHASLQAELTTIDAEVRQGTQEDAIEHSCGVNAYHGLKRKHGDIERAIKRLRELPKWKNKTHQEIADHIHVSRGRVSQVLKDPDVKINQTSVNQPVEPKEATDRVGNSPSIDDRRKTVENFLSQTPNWRDMSHRAIARICGVDHKTVATIIKDLFPEPEPEPAVETISEPEPEIVSVMEVEPTPEPEPESPMLPETVEDNLPETPEPEPELKVEPELGKVVEPEPQPELEAQEDGKAKKSASLSALQSSKSNEWYTPVVYIEAVRELMGDIDLDPASCEEANRIVQAKRYYTEEDDGLAWDWWFDEDEQIPARVFLNPPYGFGEEGKSNQEIWSHRLMGQYKMGFVSEAVLLVNATTEAKWFRPLKYDYLICFTDYRIRFWNSEKDQPTQGNAFIYFGPREKKGKFIEMFSRFGVVMERAK